MTAAANEPAGHDVGPSRPPDGARAFATTQWSIVLRAGREQGSESRDALGRLCRTYWYPLYAHVRRRGHAPADAEDLTQAFFARLLEGRVIGRADPARGRFRSFLLTTLDHFLIDEWQRSRARKRGGGGTIASLDVEAAERRLENELADADAPDRAFDRRWAMALLEAVLRRLEAEHARDGKAGLFRALKPTLVGSGEAQPYAVLAAQLGLTEGAVKVAVHRLRRRYRELLRAEIAETVTSAEEARDELQHLFRALARE